MDTLNLADRIKAHLELLILEAMLSVLKRLTNKESEKQMDEIKF